MAASGHEPLLLQVYHHAVLPRDVPGREDSNLFQIESELAGRMTDAVKSLIRHAPSKDFSSLDTIRLALSTCRSLNVEGAIDKTLLVKELQQLDTKYLLMLHVTEQNAALLIYRYTDGSGAKQVIFEAFETSATCEKVLATENALQWDFPGQAVAIPHETFVSEDFQQSLSTFLEQASFESVKEFAAITHKAQAPIPEIRDTSKPTLVTSALMAILEANGSVFDTPLLRKRVHDTVSFFEAYKPWRRSAFYLMLRVATQRHLYTLFGADLGRLYYKTFMCILLSHLLSDGLHIIPDAASDCLRKKLGRRLAKLELYRDRGSEALQMLHCHIFATLRPELEKSLSAIAHALDAQWTAHKQRTGRIVWPVKRFASSTDLELRLENSGPVLDLAIEQRWSTVLNVLGSPDVLLGRYEGANTHRPFVAILQRYLPLFNYDAKSPQGVQTAASQGNPSLVCIQYACKIQKYVAKFQDAYLGYPEFLSQKLLKLMEMWKSMDEHALACYPLLGHYHPSFEAGILDILQLSTLSELKRLKALQTYIAVRCRGWCGRGSKTIFDPPEKDSFAARYYDESNESVSLQTLRENIEQHAQKVLLAKEKEWKEKKEDHDGKTERMAGLSCPFITVTDEYGRSKQEHQKGCFKHKLKWQAGQIKIKIHEHPLPRKEHDIKATVFELMCPKAYAAYRDATWLILSSFAFPPTEPVDNVPLLRDYTGLRKFLNTTKSSVTLGSTTKAETVTHREASGFPIPLRKLIVPFGLKLRYFDSLRRSWTSGADAASFVHLFELKLSADSPYCAFNKMGQHWPTSNEIISAQSQCPPDLNAHEYMAWQGLLLGVHTRWPCLLRELGSTTINFSTQSTWAILSWLCLQAGPSTSTDVLRDSHSIFRDTTFCERLLVQVDNRLDIIRRNWREAIQLDMLVTILLRVMALNSDTVIYSTVVAILAKAREISQEWYANLDISVQEGDSGPAVFAIWAAVLCKRTFYPLLEDPIDVSSRALKTFLVASIALQDCLVGNFDALPYALRNAILRDLASAFSLRYELERVIVKETLLEALIELWPVPGESTSRMHLDAQSWWITLTLSTTHTSQHHIHYNVIHGTLLVNGQQLGSLPLEYRNWPIIEELFGAQAVKTYPSTLPGMSLVVNRQMPSDHWVHLGFRKNSLVIRAEHRDHILELFYRSQFNNNFHYDLPNALSEDCYHWLDLDTGKLEIRHQDPWRTKRSNWVLDLTSRQATRNNGSRLVDPHSQLATRIAQNFHLFEESLNITVFQPRRGPLRVELKRLELDFEVTKEGRLSCPQLGAIIADTPAQDIGTWHGLKSKIVMQAIEDVTKRIILLPMGGYRYQREGSHISIKIVNEGSYLKFSVNDVLGRIDCAAEPLLLYHRAFWHAMTAHFLPDSLTGRTGVDQALHYLQSGAYLPWTPLKPSAYNILLDIAKLTPQRGYYPPTMKTMESLQWDHLMPIFMQDDRYRRAVDQILCRNTDLLQFTQHSLQGQLPSARPGEPHLENRAICRINSASDRTEFADIEYSSRDQYAAGLERANVAMIATVLREWPSHITSTTRLASLLENMAVIGGYVRSFNEVQITNILEADIGVEWGALVRTALQCSHEAQFQMTFLFSILAFKANANMELLLAIMSFALCPELKTILLPRAAAYSKFTQHEAPDVDNLVALMTAAKQPYIARKRDSRDETAARQAEHEETATRACRAFAESIVAQWPSDSLDLTRLPRVKSTLLDQDEALISVLPVWKKLVDNAIFCRHIEEVQMVLWQGAEDKQSSTIPPTPVSIRKPRQYVIVENSRHCPCLADVLEKDIGVLTHTEAFKAECDPTPHTVLKEGSDSFSSARQNQHLKPEIKELKMLIAPLNDSPSVVHKRYGDELSHSITALSDHISKPAISREPFNPTKLANDISSAKRALGNIFKLISQALREGDTGGNWLHVVGLWPDVTTLTLLAELRSTSGVRYGKWVKEALVSLGLAITTYQRLLRIRDATQKNQHQQSMDERENRGHTTWSPLDHADWLLLEIESNVLLRPEQVEVAQSTISPTSGQNSVLQLLMGQGKTSCILPMVALELANENLFRIVVPRPLLLQSAQIMQARLGGLLDREVIHIPFSRKTPTNRTLVESYGRLHRHVQSHCGIVLALPENILSFKLSGLQLLCDGKIKEARPMIQIQDTFDRNARDVLDECDVTLGIRTQLIYPSGSQETVDGHPLRWQTVQSLLSLVFSYMDDLVRKYPKSIEIARKIGMPLVYFLRKDVEDYLITQLLQRISSGQTDILPVKDASQASQNDLRHFISEPEVDAGRIDRISAMFEEKAHYMDVAFHLRGLFLHGILMSTLKKRWNVQYGLHPARDPIAVPYQAKGIPSPTAEWGHPDVAIILTCLSFYYEGLNLAQFKSAFNQLARSSEPSIEYSSWVLEGVPETFKSYNAINVDDNQQLRELHQYVRYKACLVDFYLNSLVFPQHAKQFSEKLTASGSDLVLYDPMCPTRAATTGFSGTNDTRHQLPMTIRQNDLPQLAHTNAEVLVYLLELRNRRYVRMVDPYNKRLTEVGLLKKLLKPYGNQSDTRDRIRILIDSGAQILEHDNRSLAKAWLEEDREAAAAIYFDDIHRVMVVYRKGSDLPLVASPFAESLEDCLVYVDESHCRGTDLKFPPEARAAVTLGPHLTKDALVQAAMRLRLLGKTQSVAFFSPPEVHQSILDLRSLAKNRQPGPLESTDVIRWLLHQTCSAIEQLEPLYFNQTIDYFKRTQARLDYPDYITNSASRNAYLKAVRSKEVHSLRKLYGPKYCDASVSVEPAAFTVSLQEHVIQILHRREGFLEHGSVFESSTLEEVEQERETEFELECVREVQGPVYFDAMEIVTLHRDIKTFAISGRMPAGSDAFQPMFLALQKTALGLKHGTIIAPGTATRLFISSQFTSTVDINNSNDNFLRPCHWLLWSYKYEVGLLVSPEEANALIPMLRHAAKAMCHIIVYSAPITHRMLQFNDMNYYAAPHLPETFKAPVWLKVELGIFAGRLYFEWDEYEELMSYLGSDKDKAFAKKPLAFLHDWLASCRKGNDFEHTPMGYITTGKPLSVNHPFFSTAISNEGNGKEQQFAAQDTHAAEVDDDRYDSEDDEDCAKEYLFHHDDDEDDEEYAFHDAEEFAKTGSTLFNEEVHMSAGADTENVV